ncbi:MAG: hypothetical protein U5K37_06545 [Natrialbaceae archaeon]|nr:hypothetical protein [Natrialbaceae archaeon]
MTSVTMLSHAFLPGIIEAIADRVPAGQTTEIITVPAVIDAIAADGDLGEQIRAVLEHDSVSVLEYSDEIPHILAIADGTVSMGVQDGNGRVLGVIDSDTEAVLAWAESTVATYREQANPVELDRLK